MLAEKKRIRISAEDYIYASARVRAREASLFGRETFSRMAEAGDFEAALRILAESGLTIVRDPEGEADVEATLDAYLREAFSLVAESVPDPALFSFLLLPYDCHNLKSAIKCSLQGKTLAGGEFDRLFLGLGRFSREEIAAMVAKRDFSPLPEAMQKAAPEALLSYRSSRDPQEIDRLLDRASFADMLALSERYGLKSFSGIVRMRIDLVNLLTCFRTLRLGERGGETFLRFFLPGGTLAEGDFADAFRQDGAAFLRRLSAGPFAPLSEGAARSFAVLEKLADDLYLAALKQSGQNVYGPEVVAAFLVRREYEVKNLRLLLAAKRAGLPAEFIRERLRVL